MKCITSPALDNLDIAMYVDGEAEDAVVAHIQQCPFCTERARQWTLLQKSLRKQLYRVNCPTPMELGDYHLSYLPAPRALVVSRHLRECLFCQREVQVLEDFLTDLSQETSLLGAVKVLIARVLGQQSENGLVTALRGEAKGPLTFEVDGILILLDIQLENVGTFAILGQVAAEDQEQWTEAVAELRRNNELQFSTTVDDLGAFRFEGIMSGEQELRILPKGASPALIANFEIST